MPDTAVNQPRHPPTESAELDLTDALQLLRRAGYPEVAQGDAGTPAGLQQIIDGLCELSQRDTLTGLANTRRFMAALEQEVDRVSRSGELALVLLIDIDRFKSINDTHGHLAGDQALRTVAEVLTANVRPMDTAARYGGDEFAVILPNCRPVAGHAIAERICRHVERTPVGLADGTVLRLTSSIGGAHISPWRKVGAKDILQRADEELYRAKAQGRNQVVMDLSMAMPVSADEKLQLLGQDGDE